LELHCVSVSEVEVSLLGGRLGESATREAQSKINLRVDKAELDLTEHDAFCWHYNIYEINKFTKLTEKIAHSGLIKPP
jgi:hypothetical protein